MFTCLPSIRDRLYCCSFFFFAVRLICNKLFFPLPLSPVCRVCLRSFRSLSAKEKPGKNEIDEERKNPFNMHLFNYEELNRAHEKTTIFFSARRHLKCYAKSSLEPFSQPAQACWSSEFVSTEEAKKKILVESHMRRTSLPISMLNTEFTSARIFAMFHHISPYLHQFGSPSMV